MPDQRGWRLGAARRTGRGAFTAHSYNDYEIVAANLFDGERRRISDASRRTPCSSTRRWAAPG